MTDQSGPLSWDVYVAPPEPLPRDDLAPGQEERYWSPISATLISGERDAVLVDALLTAGQATDLTEWVAAQGKNLTAIYITHGHGDHWFGLGTVLDRCPTARAVALPAVIEQMRAGSTPELLESFWKPRFDGKLVNTVPEARGDAAARPPATASRLSVRVRSRALARPAPVRHSPEAPSVSSGSEQSGHS